ncbi:MAG: hypothetical protein ACFFG0_06205 [Candidatus Thorarchaeota archaeon]
MPKREAYVRIRLYDKEKEDWEKYAEKNKFASVSQFIRYVISEYIEQGSNRASKTNNNENSVSKSDLLKLLKEEKQEREKERDEFFMMINEVLQERSRLADIKIEDSIKGKVLKWLEKFPNQLGSEDIAELIGKPEPETLDILNKMTGQKLIKLTKNMKYQVIFNENNN